jgi:two-component system, OmpR family, phosphate regulon sensor histidine kinase PhoR
MIQDLRKKRLYRWPIVLTVILMALNITLMVSWIILLASLSSWKSLTIGVIVFSLILIGLTIYLLMSLSAYRLHQRQVNFVDSVTHELKSPIASLRLYLETLQMRSLEEEKREEFYKVMDRELQRLDDLISQLLEVGRLDAIGHETDPEEIALIPLIENYARTASSHHGFEMEDIFVFNMEPVVIHARRMLLDMIFGNLLDNAVKYASDNPEVCINMRMKDRDKIVIEVIDNGEGVPKEIQKKIFQIFYRAGDELHRKQKGTGLGLYVVRTLVHFLRGEITVKNRTDNSGSIFLLELPGRAKG